MPEGKYLKPLHFNQALSVASPAAPASLKEFFYKPGKDPAYDPYRIAVLDWLKTTKLPFLRDDFLADMQNQADVDKWLGYTPRSTVSTAMCVSNALSELGKNQQDPSPAGEKFTWEIDYLLYRIFKVPTMVNTAKLLTAHKAVEHVKANPGTYLAVLFLRKDFAGKEMSKNPKKSVEAGGISHMQVWKMPDPDAPRSGRFQIVDIQSGAEAWLQQDIRAILWKIS